MLPLFIHHKGLVTPLGLYYSFSSWCWTHTGQCGKYYAWRTTTFTVVLIILFYVAAIYGLRVCHFNRLLVSDLTLAQYFRIRYRCSSLLSSNLPVLDFGLPCCVPSFLFWGSRSWRWPLRWSSLLWLLVMEIRPDPVDQSKWTHSWYVTTKDNRSFMYGVFYRFLVCV